MAKAGEWVTAPGRWIQDQEFGLQLRIEMLSGTAPTTKEGVETHLGTRARTMKSLEGSTSLESNAVGEAVEAWDARMVRGSRA